MLKLLHDLNLYERFNRLVSHEGRKIFIHTVYTLSICTVGILFIWYLGIANISTKGQNILLPAADIQTALNPETAYMPQKSGTHGKSSVKATVDTVENKRSHQISGTYEKEKINVSGPRNQPGNNAGNAEQTKIKTAEKQNTAGVKNIKTSPSAIQAGSPANEKKNYGKVQKTIYKGATDKPQVAVTFDDGYNRKMIEKVLAVLKKNNIKCTFFIIGSVLDDYPGVWKQAIDEGHQICNHTNYHEVLTEMPDDKVKNEITGWEASAEKALGKEYVNKMKKEFPYLRLPGGGGNKSDRILSIAQACGYKVIGWSIETNSSIINPLKKTNTAEEISRKIEQHVVSKCSNGSIILLHFNQYDTENIDAILQGIGNRGYEMKLISEIIK